MLQMLLVCDSSEWVNQWLKEWMWRKQNASVCTSDGLVVERMDVEEMLQLLVCEVVNG